MAMTFDPETKAEGHRYAQDVITARVASGGKRTDAMMPTDRTALWAALDAATDYAHALIVALARERGEDPVDLWADIVRRNPVERG
jgi:hypothetical protein